MKPLDDENEDEELNEEEVEVLREAGILPRVTRRVARKKRSVKGMHVVFAEDADEGALLPLVCILLLLLTQFNSRKVHCVFRRAVGGCGQRYGC